MYFNLCHCSVVSAFSILIPLTISPSFIALDLIMTGNP